MFKNFKISNKLLIIFLLIGALPAMGVGVVSLWKTHNVLSEQVFKQLESLRDVKKIQLEDFFSERQIDMQVLLDIVSHLRQNAWDKLQSVQESKAVQIENYFQNRLNDIRILSHTEAVAHAIEQLDEAFELDGGEAGLTWSSILGLVEHELEYHRRTLGYQDLLLINTDGLVVYSSLQGKEFGTNLLDGEYNDTGLGLATKIVLNEKRLHMQDFSIYPPANNELALFSLGPVYRFDKLVGILAFRMDARALDNIVQRRKGMGKTGESFLVGDSAEKGHVLRSNRLIPNSNRKIKLDTPIEGDDVEKALKGNSGFVWKYGVEDKLRVSAYSHINIPNLNWGLISTIDVEEILTPHLSKEKDDFFNNYIKQYGYDDLLLIHPEGKIFYSIHKDLDYNSNILSGKYSDSHLGRLIKNVSIHKTFAISDYAPYAPSDNKPVAFLAQPLLNEHKEIELIVAIKLHDAMLNRIMQQREGMGETGETYLVGEDQRMRSNSFLAPETHSVDNSFFHPETGEVKTKSAFLAHTGNTGKLIGENYRGDNVLSAYTPLKVGDKNWALIAEINSQESFAFIKQLQLFISLIIVLGLISVWYLSRGFTYKLINPLTQINSNLKKLAGGEQAEQEIVYEGRDEISELVTSAQSLRNALDSTIAQADAIAAGNYNQEVRLLSERDRLGNALSGMTRTLRRLFAENEDQTWLKNGLAKLNEYMRGVQDVVPLSQKIISFLANHLDTPLGTFYFYDETEKTLKLISSYAYNNRRGNNNQFKLGEGIIGQAALEQKTLLIQNLPNDYILIQSSLGESVPHYVMVLPILYENQIKGVIELASFKPFSTLQQEFLEQAAPGIGIGLYTAESRTKLTQLLSQTQDQATELQSQSEELQAQQEELQQSNDSLEMRSQALEQQKEAIRAQNLELEKAKQATEQKANELELASKYKSEFLANMSHELRTPLNSMLILAQLLSSDKNNNLSDKQLEHANTIHHAGKDLLNLINEILDLSKIEAGRIDLDLEKIRLTDFIQSFEQRFKVIAEEKNIQFKIEFAEKLPQTIQNNGQRLQQVITNLISNSLKFTPKDGMITLRVQRPQSNETNFPQHLTAANSLVFHVKDTGIGIPKEKQSGIFEAFRQADGSTSRKFGGTGLGLSISRQLVKLMNGELHVQSAENKGSCFSIFIPEQVGSKRVNKLMEIATETEIPNSVTTTPTPVFNHQPQKKEENLVLEDDREQLKADDKVLLIVEDDADFRHVLADLAHEQQFKCLLAGNGQQALDLVQQHKPQAVILDLGLPEIDGLSVLVQLKKTLDTRHIPIYCVSAADKAEEAQQLGAIGYLLKPAEIDDIQKIFLHLNSFISKKSKQLLLIASQAGRDEDIINLLDNTQTNISKSSNNEEILKSLQQQHFDCIAIDLGEHPDHFEWDLLENLSDWNINTPLIFYKNYILTDKNKDKFNLFGRKHVVHFADSQEELLDKVNLFLHQLETTLPLSQQTILKKIQLKKDNVLKGKQVLLVDDDIRNSYSLSAMLEEKDMLVTIAKNGQYALDALEKDPHIDIVLMDIMMPEMDGYEAMKHIRGQDKFKKLPIIALTAKAMKHDKAKCIQAGANDYLSKPIDSNKLLSLIQIWLYKS